MTSRTEIAAIVARLRRHARRASIEKGYKVHGMFVTSRTRNEMALHLRERARSVEESGVVSPYTYAILNKLDEANPWKKSRGKRS